MEPNWNRTPEHVRYTRTEPPARNRIQVPGTRQMAKRTSTWFASILRRLDGVFQKKTIFGVRWRVF